MKKIPKLKIPQKCKTLTKQINFIGNKIDKLYYEGHDAAATATQRMVKMGDHFRFAKKVVKKHKGSWGYHLSHRFPYISQRTVERYMDLSRHVNLEKHPALAFLSQDVLITLIVQRGDTSSIGKVLKRYDVDSTRTLEDREAIGLFKKEVDAIIQRKRGGWHEDSSSLPLRDKKKQEKAASKLKKNLRDMRKQPWEKGPLESVVKQVESRAKTVKKGLRVLMEHTPQIYKEIEMWLLEDLQSALVEFLEHYDSPDDL